MAKEYVIGKIEENIKIEDGVYELSVGGNFSGNPGQFYMLRGWREGPFLNRPISISNIYKDKIIFLYELRGKGTKIFSELKENDEIKLIGPLGRGFSFEKDEKVALVSGGIGIAPFVYLSRKMTGNIDLYAGFRKKPYIIKDLKENINRIYISTEDGSVGYKGLVTGVFNPEGYTKVYTCGPISMMKAVVKICIEKNIPVEVSMESRMACGIGACLGCTIETISGMKRVCKEGPVFNGREVVFDA